MKMVLAWAWYQAKELEGVEQPYAFLENIDWEKARMLAERRAIAFITMKDHSNLCMYQCLHK